MSKLKQNQKRLLFDYCFDLTTKTDTVQAQNLITTHSEAAHLCERIKAALAPLETLHTAHCPDYLVDKTIAAILPIHCEQNG